MNKPGNSSGSDDRSADASRGGDDARAKRTPNTDMQAEDAGTADSGVDTDTGSDSNDASNSRPASGSSGQGAMKQTSKTPTERGSR